MLPRDTAGRLEVLEYWGGRGWVALTFPFPGDGQLSTAVGLTILTAPVTLYLAWLEAVVKAMQSTTYREMVLFQSHGVIPPPAPIPPITILKYRFQHIAKVGAEFPGIRWPLVSADRTTTLRLQNIDQTFYDIDRATAPFANRLSPTTVKYTTAAPQVAMRASGYL
ncbi:MAG: hypothetical protein IPG01_19550 [Chitinophagaceae bacterium]|nr:hypothetical protein [Chitinophagaceae bacterium]